MPTVTLGQMEAEWRALALSGIPKLVTDVALGANASYTQAGQHRFDDVLIGDVGAFVYTDRPGTLYLEESNDLSSWSQVSSLSCSAGLNRMLPAALSRRYWRLRYVNGATAQGIFRLYQQAFSLLDLRTQLTGSSIPDTQPVPTIAKRDAVMRAIDSILDTIGAENVRLFLPMWESSGSVARDLLRRDLTFDLVGVTFGGSGPFGTCLSLDGVNDYIVQTSVTANTVGAASLDLNAGDKKAATRLKAVYGYPGFVRLTLKRTGTLNAATVRVAIYTDNSGVPGSAISDGTSVTVACSAIGTSFGPVGFPFTVAPSLAGNSKYWIVLEYVDATGVDASNYISWQYETGANTYGERRAVYDGATWTATDAENHVFSLYDNRLALPDDWTIIAVYKETGTTNGYLWRLDIVDSQNGSCAYFYNGRLVVYFNDGTDRLFYYYRRPTEFTAWAFVFSKAASTDKGKLYANGALVASANGTAGAAHAQLCGPWQFGNYFTGLIGPVILAKKALTDVELGKVFHNLLVLRKLGVEV